MDGANGWQRLRFVTLPMISPSIFFNIVIGIIFVWQVFAVPQIMIPTGGPKRAAYFYTMYLYDTAFRNQRFGYACVLSWVQLAIIVALTAPRLPAEPAARALSRGRRMIESRLGRVLSPCSCWL